MKFLNWREIQNPEEQYIGLCGGCLVKSGIEGIPDPLASDEEYQDDTPDEEIPDAQAEG